jgi:hypothetical protein
VKINLRETYGFGLPVALKNSNDSLIFSDLNLSLDVSLLNIYGSFLRSLYIS